MKNINLPNEENDRQTKENKSYIRFLQAYPYTCPNCGRPMKVKSKLCDDCGNLEEKL